MAAPLPDGGLQQNACNCRDDQPCLIILHAISLVGADGGLLDHAAAVTVHRCESTLHFALARRNASFCTVAKKRFILHCLSSCFHLLNHGRCSHSFVRASGSEAAAAAVVGGGSVSSLAAQDGWLVWSCQAPVKRLLLASPLRQRLLLRCFRLCLCVACVLCVCAVCTCACVCACVCTFWMSQRCGACYGAPDCRVCGDAFRPPVMAWQVTPHATEEMMQPCLIDLHAISLVGQAVCAGPAGHIITDAAGSAFANSSTTSSSANASHSPAHGGGDTEQGAATPAVAVVAMSFGGGPGETPPLRPTKEMSCR